MSNAIDKQRKALSGRWLLPLLILAAAFAALAAAPAIASAANHEVFVYETEWDPDTLQIDQGDSVTWAVDRNRLGGRETGHDLWVCEGEDVGFEQVQCFWDPSDPTATPPDNYVGHRAYCGTTNPPPPGECDDGDPSDLTLTFDEPGVYTYLCMIHGQMRGTLTVGSTAPLLPKLKFKLKPKKKNLKQGKSQKFKVVVNNNKGEGAATNVRVCPKGNKKKVKFKKKCVKLGNIAAGKKKNTKIKFKAKKGRKAAGNAKVRFKVKVGNHKNKTLKAKVKVRKK